MAIVRGHSRHTRYGRTAVRPHTRKQKAMTAVQKNQLAKLISKKKHYLNNLKLDRRDLTEAGDMGWGDTEEENAEIALEAIKHDKAMLLAIQTAMNNVKKGKKVRLFPNGVPKGWERYKQYADDYEDRMDELEKEYKFKGQTIW